MPTTVNFSAINGTEDEEEGLTSAVEQDDVNIPVTESHNAASPD